MTVVIVVAVIFIVIAVFISMYNGLVKLRNNRENAFANIDVQLKQRFDLVPQLVSTVKGYATHEKEVLEKVTAARAAAMSATTIDEKVAADKALSGALAGLRVSLEAYPELKKRMAHVAGLPQAYKESVVTLAVETEPVKFAKMKLEGERCKFWDEWADRLLEDTKPDPEAVRAQGK